MFVIGASIYLYSRRKTVANGQSVGKIKRWVKDFSFVWILLGLLVLYVGSVGLGSYPLFAAGNVVVEIILVLYVVKNGDTARNVT